VDNQTLLKHGAADRESPRLLTAREKLEQYLDQIYWPGYSSWSSARQRNEPTDQQPRADVTPTAEKPAHARSEQNGALSSDAPELRAHTFHDDTTARPQRLNAPDDERESSSQPADPPAGVEPRDGDEAPETDWRDEPANAAPSRYHDVVGAKEHERTVDDASTDGSALLDKEDVATGTDSTPEPPAGTGDPAESGHEFVEDATTEEMDQYRRIREADDLDALAENSGMPREVIDEAKQHLFQRQHDVAIGPDDVRHGYFTPDAAYGDLWERVASGIDMTDENRVQFWSLLAHEYVEAKLMEAGVPYKSGDPDAWDEYGSAKVSPDHPSAHNTAPLSTQSEMKDLLRHWDSRLAIPRGGLRVEHDLSNLDEVVRVAKEGLGL